MKKLLIFPILLVYYFSFGQKNEKPVFYQFGLYADIGADFIYLRYIRNGLQIYVSKNFSILGTLKIGARSRQRSHIPLEREGVPVNWINWHEGNPAIFSVDPNQELGIKSFSIKEGSLFYSNFVLSAGWDIKILRNLDFQMLGGAGLRYTDEHHIGESGDAIFEINGVEHQLYYLVPVFQRGFDAHLSLESSLVYAASDKLSFKGGLVSDFSLGSFTVGVGNYYHLGASILIKI